MNILEIEPTIFVYFFFTVFHHVKRIYEQGKGQKILEWCELKLMNVVIFNQRLRTSYQHGNNLNWFIFCRSMLSIDFLIQDYLFKLKKRWRFHIPSFSSDYFWTPLLLSASYEKNWCSPILAHRWILRINEISTTDLTLNIEQL